MQLFVRADRTLCLDVELSHTVWQLKEELKQRIGVNVSEQRLVCGGRPLQEDTVTLAAAGVRPLATVQLLGRLRGGKGGFGALLRAGARSSRNENVDACRDLSGRRLRHVNADKTLRDWAAGARERELEKIALQHIKTESKAAERAARAEVHLPTLTPRGSLDSLGLGAQTPSQRVDVDEARRDHQEGMVMVREAIGTAVAGLPAGNKREGGDGAAAAAPKRARLFADASEGGSSSDDSSDDEEQAAALESPAAVGAAAAADVTDVAAKGAAAGSAGETPEAMAVQPAGRAGVQPTGSDSGDSAATGPAVRPSLADSPVSDVASPTTSPVAKLPPVPAKGEGLTVTAAASPAAAQEPVVLGQFESAEALQAAGMARLAAALGEHGMKIGGSLAERAARLFLLRSTPLAELDRKHFAKPAGKGAGKAGSGVRK